MIKKRLMAILLVGAMTVSLLAGCKSKDAGKSVDNPGETQSEVTKGANDPEKKDDAGSNEEFVELSFYMMNGPVNDPERIMEKANVIIKEKINAKLNLIMVDGAAYADKMNLMINSGDSWDLSFTASWGGINFFENAAKGAYADLTDLLPTYAPESYARIPEGLWEGVKANGKIYAVVNYQQWGSAKQNGFKVRKDLADEFNFDWKAIKGKPTLEAMKLLEPYIGKALEKYPEMIGWETLSTHSFFANEPLFWDMEAVGDMTTPGWIRYAEPNKVINQFETEEFAEYCNIMRDWYKKGYVRKDGATVKDEIPDRKAAKFVAEYGYGWPDSIEVPENKLYMSMTTYETAPAYTVSTTRTVIPAAAASTAAVAINSQSPNIERSLQLIELLNTDDELYKLITLGEEGIDYVYDEEGKYTQVEGKYNFNWNEWQIGQSFSPEYNRALYHKNAQGDLDKKLQGVVFDAEKTADVSPVTGFTFDTTPVKTQLANCSSIFTEMIPALSSGSVDPAKALPEFLQRLETAGVKEIIAEKQKQLDAWHAAN